MENKTAIFRRGVPTDADVNALRKAFPLRDMTPGTKIFYDDVERVLAVKRHFQRFKTVTEKWRRELETESGIILKCVPGESFQVCTESNKAQLSSQKAKEAARKAKRSMQIAGHVDRGQLTDDERKVFDASKIFAAAVIGMQQVKKQAELPTI